MRRVPVVAASVIGMLLVFGLWHLLPGWDLSEETLSGKRIPGGGDDLAPKIGSVLAVVTLLVIVVAVAARWTPLKALGAQALISATWVLVWVWRVSMARVGGANLWPVGLVMAVIPLACVSMLIVGVVVAVADRRMEDASP